MKTHIPVLLDEVVSYLKPELGGTFVDCTFGAGGYSKKILSYPNTKVIAFDKDPDIKSIADNMDDSRFKFIQDGFENIAYYIKSRVDGIVFDLGASTMQLTSEFRGFSFNHDAPLDMRMNNANGPTALDLISTVSQEELANIIYEYGGETRSRILAKKIIEYLPNIKTTKDLTKVIYDAVGNKRMGKIDRSTKVFQALRIWVNDELGSLNKALLCLENLLRIGGRLVFVSFHSLEDRIVKRYLSENTPPKRAISKYHLPISKEQYLYETLTKKPVKPSIKEVLANPSSRSAKLRAAIKIGEIYENSI